MYTLGEEMALDNLIFMCSLQQLHVKGQHKFINNVCIFSVSPYSLPYSLYF